MNTIGGLFDFADRLQMAALNQRLIRSEIISSNIANAETPGFRAIGYNFEKQLQEVSGTNDPIAVRTTNPRHLRNSFVSIDGKVMPEVFVRPSESVANDGNTVDIDKEMALLAQNQILYRASVELLNKKIGMLRYAITNGGK